LGPAADQEAAARGQTIFVQNCGFCHGPNATGAEGPDLLRSTVVLHDEKGERIGEVVTKGRPDRGMPSFSGMTPEQISDIAQFLHARVEAAANRFGYKVQNVVTGNATEGEKYFTGAGHCNQCHSATGDLAHIATKFEPADLQAQFLYPARTPNPDPEERGDPAQPVVTVTLPSGETISGKLKRIDEFNISLWDQSGEFHSWPRSEVKVEIHDPLQAHRDLLAQYTDSDMHNVLAYLETLK
jgi:cytochrome c oxidase cbb3-type subunit III